MISTKPEQVEFISIAEQPEVVAQGKRVSDVAALLKSAEDHFLELATIVNPPDRAATDPSVEITKLQLWEAQAALPAAKLTDLKYRLEYEREADALRELRSNIRKQLTVARTRSGERHGLMKSLFAKLREAEQLVWQIADFDMETARLGADRPPMLFLDFGRGAGSESYLGRREKLARDRGELVG